MKKNVIYSFIYLYIYFSGNATYYSRAYFGEGNGSIAIDDLQCNGTESNIGHCLHSAYDISDCYHGEDVSVYCPRKYYSHFTL